MTVFGLPRDACQHDFDCDYRAGSLDADSRGDGQDGVEYGFIEHARAAHDLQRCLAIDRVDRLLKFGQCRAIDGEDRGSQRDADGDRGSGG